MNTPPFSPESHLAALLRMRLAITNVNRQVFPPGWTTPDEIIVTNRYILVLAGTLSYRVEGSLAKVEAGQILFVPAWVRRQWKSFARQSCELLWCEFSSDDSEAGMNTLNTLYWKRASHFKLEAAALRRMFDLWPGIRIALEFGKAKDSDLLPEMKRLQLEGELKGSLARFWQEALPLDPAVVGSPLSRRNLHPDIRTALLWLSDHFPTPDAMQRLYKKITLSPNHFRLLFRKQVGCNPQSFLSRLRLRRAHYLVRESAFSLKQISAMVGYVDPLFFSRQYRRFWGQSPRSDRKK